MTTKRRKVLEEASTEVYTDELIFDLQLEILSWLPAPSVVRFRSVCKAWNESIKREDFVEKHLARSYQLQKHSRSPTSFLLVPIRYPIHQKNTTILLELWESKKCKARTINCSNGDLPPYQLFLCTTNGLVCSQPCLRTTFVMNPITNKIISLPRLPFSCIWMFTFVFGFVPETKEYKVLAEFCPIEDNTFYAVCNIPIHGTPQHWRTLTNSTTSKRLGRPFTYPPTLHVRVNGLMHWLSMKTTTVGHLITIQSFDLYREKFDIVSIEKVESTPWNGLSKPLLNVLEVEGRLGVVKLLKGSLQLWRLQEYDNHDSWVHMLSFNSPLFNPPSLSDSPLKLHCFWKGGKLFVYFHKQIICCDPKTSQCHLQFTVGAGVAIVPFVTSLIGLS